MQEFLRMPEKKDPKQQFHSVHPKRWPTLGPAICHVIDLWPALLECFLYYVPLKKHLKNAVLSAKYLKIVSYLKRKNVLAELKFVYSLSELLQNSQQHFRKTNPLCTLHAKLKNFLLTVLARLVKPDILMSLERQIDKLLFSPKSSFHCQISLVQSH